MEEKEIKPQTYFFYALLIFLLLSSEVLVFFVDRIIDGRDISQWMSWAIHWYGAVSHWIITILIWGTGAYLSYKWCIKNNMINKLINFQFDRITGVLIVVAAIIILIKAIIESSSNNDVIQLLREYKGFVKMYNGQAWIVSIFQNIYYLFESILVLIMVIFFQRSGELWFKNKIIPWGSIGLVLTWGVVHFLSHPSGAVGVVIWSALSGLFYSLSKKNFYPSFAIIFLVFVI